MIKAALQLLASLFGLAKDRNAAAQRPEMQANAKAKTDAEIQQDAREAVVEKDLKDLRNRLS